MKVPLGKKRWAIAEGYIPVDDADKPREQISHEAICILNADADDAHVNITAYYKDRDPSGPYRFTVPSQRTAHLRTNDFKDPEPIPKGTEYSIAIESDVCIVVQHTRLDSRWGQLALLSTIAYASE